MKVDAFPDRTISVDDKNYLYFGGTAYLGLATHKEFQNHIIEGIRKWGAFFGSSRNANVKLSIYDTAESQLAEWVKAEATATVSSGALAGKLVLDYLSKTSSSFFHYPKTHPAIVAKDSLPLFVNGKLHPKLTDQHKEHIVISADAMLALEVYPTSFNFLETIPEYKTITLLLDESHSIGLLGKSGCGIFSTINSARLKQKIMVTSLSKALGLSGGLIAGDRLMINDIKNESAFVSSSSANPAYLHAFVKGHDIYEVQQKNLKSNMAFLFSLLKPEILESQNEAYPVLYFQKEGFYNSLLKRGIIITSFEYPSYTSPMNRVVITANHTKEDLKTLASALNQMA